YYGTPLVDLAFDERRGVIPNEGGRVLDLDGDPVPGVYTTGWIKRGPVGLIGHTKGDALETVENLLADQTGQSEPARHAETPEPSEDGVLRFLDEKNVAYTTWTGWGLLDA